MPEVAHNYRREHAWNMWFVLGCATPQGIADNGFNSAFVQTGPLEQ